MPTIDATITCSVTLVGFAEYDKASGSTHINENGSSTGTSSCGAVYVPVLDVDVHITHQCFGGQHATSGSKNGSGPGPVYASAYQSVAAANFFQWCYYGSVIRWRFHLHAQSNSGDHVDLCLFAAATYGGGIAQEKENTPCV